MIDLILELYLKENDNNFISSWLSVVEQEEK
jgi:hypothetical protein